jgi:hypothetical protein
MSSCYCCLWGGVQAPHCPLCAINHKEAALPAREPHEATICACGEVRPPGYGMCRVDACRVFKAVPFEG